MKVYSDSTVYDEALVRINRIFDEFENVVVAFSGGKDSTVTFNLAMKIATERNRLPLDVMFLDQEVESSFTIEYVKEIMYRKDVRPFWYQMPFRLFNASSESEPWLICWEEEKKHLWVREKDPISIQINDTPHDRFVKLLDYLTVKIYGMNPVACLAGLRSEESPARALGLSQSLTYKDITWGKIKNKKIDQYNFYPIYDWTYVDIWKAIHDNNWSYCKLYDFQYMYGVSINNMRVSSFIHETSLAGLFYLQEVDKEVYNKICNRISGVNTVNILQDSFYIKKLPFMFKDWFEYRDYLLVNLINVQEHQELFRKKFEFMDKTYAEYDGMNSIIVSEINAILCNDYHMTKINNLLVSKNLLNFRNKQKALKNANP